MSVRVRLKLNARCRKSLDRIRFLRLEHLEERALLALTPHLVADIKAEVTTVVQPSGPIVAAGGVGYFAANDGTNGVELWRSDGTAAGTLRLRDIAPGAANGSPQFFTNVNGTVFFTADDGGPT